MSLRRRNFASTAAIYAMLSPTFGLLAVFSLVPFVWAFVTSFYDYEVGGESRFVGIDNYVEYLHDPTLLPSFANLLFLTVFGLLIVSTVPLAVAKLIFCLKSERARYLYRVLFLIPIVVPGVAGMMIWQGMIYNDTGLLNETLRLFGREDLTRGWLSDPRTVLWAVVFMGFPFAGGINILIYYAGLAGISESIHEAAELDGARGMTKFLKVDVPLVMSQVKLLTILTVIGTVQGFEGMFILTKGGPGFKTMVPGLWMYMNAFSFQRMGYACAIGVILFLLILSLTVLNMRYFRSSEELKAEGA
ncbi:MAG: sugar ABC transporter permease [Fimbriimonas sp.]|nr:sugar ABC transporter permease [Fimbriimonas sp.]